MSLVTPAMSSIMADMFPEKTRGTAFGVMLCIASIGALAASVLGGMSGLFLPWVGSGRVVLCATLLWVIVNESPCGCI